MCLFDDESPATGVTRLGLGIEYTVWSSVCYMIGLS